ncbi:MAG: DUF1127 domain-containing protein [Geminicoccaceae bacterium]
MAAHAINSHGIERSDERRLGGSSLLELLKGVAGKLTASWTWHQNYRHTVRELEGLSQRELDDIGIARCDIPVIAMQSANTIQERR